MHMKTVSPTVDRGRACCSPLVYIVVVNWNQPQLTADCLRSLRTLDYPSYRVLVVDNGSQDSSVERLQAEFGNWLEFIANETNMGFTGGNNAGIQYALEQAADYILLLNNDTIINDSHLLTALVRCTEADLSIVFASPTIRYANPEKLWYAGAHLDLWAGWTHYHTLPASSDVRDTGYASGCCMLVRTSALREIGLLRDSYFLTMEDVEWSWRARNAGWRVVYVPSVSLLHMDGASSRDSQGRGVYSPARVYYEHRNAIWFVREYGNLVQKWGIWPVRWAMRWGYRALGYIALRRWPKLRALLNAIHDGMLTPIVDDA